MASETTFDHWKVVFSWGKMRKSRFSQNPLNARFWAFGFSIYTSSSANFKKDPPWNIFFSLTACSCHLCETGAYSVHTIHYVSWICVESGLQENGNTLVLFCLEWLCTMPFGQVPPQGTYFGVILLHFGQASFSPLCTTLVWCLRLLESLALKSQPSSWHLHQIPSCLVFCG